MSEIYPPPVQRPSLLAMSERLDSRSSSLRRDECGDWRINGLDGYIYAVPEGFQFVVFKQGLRGWNVAKYRLAFCTVTQDGDTEGAFILDRLPSRAEAEIIRAVLRIPKRRHLSEAQREIATERLARARLNAQKPASPVPAVESIGRPVLKNGEGRAKPLALFRSSHALDRKCLRTGVTPGNVTPV